MPRSADEERRSPRPAFRRPGSVHDTARFPEEFRSVDGRGNNPFFPEWGAAGTPLLRVTPVAYGDGFETPAGEERKGARLISNLCAAQELPVANPQGASDYLWQWGQFLDHDLDLTPVTEPPEPFDIPVPSGDAWFDPRGEGATKIPLDRSAYVVVDEVRQQINAITAFIDASNVYGSDPVRARALRALDGSGRLRTGPGDLLPCNDRGLPNAEQGDDPCFFLAGDFRANEQVGLTALHTLFVREHNYWAARFAHSDPQLDDEAIYQQARAIVGAEMQAITYREFLPLLLGPGALAPYRGYDPSVHPGISNAFATAGYRVGHTMLPETLRRLDDDLQPLALGDLPLARAFFNPAEIRERGIEPLLRGLAWQRAQAVDNRLSDAVRNFLFGPPGAGGFDLAALNIQRGRDHGLASYNEVRLAFGLEPAREFGDIHPDPAVQADLATAYASVEDVDVWVGGLAEPHAPGAMVGETFRAILVDQFERLRDGDRFWYQGYLPPPLVREVERQTLARILRRNTAIGSEVPDRIFGGRTARPAHRR